MSRVTLGPSRSWTSELSLVIGALFRGWRMPTALGLAGLVLALTWLAIGVHFHGWVTAFDAPTTSWIRSVSHRSHGLDEASLITAGLCTPVTVAAAGLTGGALLAWHRAMRFIHRTGPSVTVSTPSERGLLTQGDHGMPRRAGAKPR
jgi:hypothetical protein